LAILANALGKTGDQQKYQALYSQIGAGFHKAFFDPKINGYDRNTLTANVFALEINAVPANLQSTIINNIVNTITTASNHSTCGILGMKYLFPLLSTNGHHDLALAIATQITYPSYGYMFNNPYENATTLWEILNAPTQGPGMNSRNHIMFGSIGAWFYRYIGGIKPNGLDEIELSPAPVGPGSPVTQATVSYDSIKGLIGVDWTKEEKFYGMQVMIPSTTTARVIIPHHDSPYTRLVVNGALVADFSSIERQLYPFKGIDDLVLRSDGCIELKVQPGKYSFLASI